MTIRVATGPEPWHRQRAVPAGAADEKDNFICRPAVERPAGVLETWVNARIQEVLERANRRGSDAATKRASSGHCRKRSA